MTVPMRAVRQALRIVGLSDDGVLPAYSGRGMFGLTCLGVVVSSVPEALAFVAALGSNNEIDGLALARRVQVDDLGEGKVVYFPGVTIETNSIPE